jgi:uncharacterized protein (UPF0212 family)
MVVDDNTGARGPETVYCANCGEGISAGVNFCPECGSEQESRETQKGQLDADSNGEKGTGLRHRFPGISKENRTRRNVLTGVGYSFVGLVALGAVAGDEEQGDSSGGSDTGTSSSDSGSSSGSGGEAQYPNAWAYSKDSGIVLRDVSGGTGQMTVEITGQATNESDQDYEYVQLEFGLYNSADTKVGDALANTSGLPAGQRWRFEAVGTYSDTTSTFRLEDITAY